MMMVRRWQRRALAVVASALLITLATGVNASASNMAFKLNKQICQLGTSPTGQNFVSLPYNNPYEGAAGLPVLCTALALSNSAQIVQWTGTGTVNVFQCGQIQQSPLLKGKGVMITEPTGPKTGIIVGSDTPNKSITIENLGLSPIGTNVISVDYHTTAVTPQDWCVDCGLSSTATISRFDACTGQVLTHTCGQIPQWNLVLGEAVMILENQGQRVCTPSHF
jgi:hypothetical protein